MISQQKAAAKEIAKEESLPVMELPIIYVRNADGTVTPANKGDFLKTIHLWRGVFFNPKEVPGFDTPMDGGAGSHPQRLGSTPLQDCINFGCRIVEMTPPEPVWYFDKSTDGYWQGYYDSQWGMFFCLNSKTIGKSNLPPSAKMVQLREGVGVWRLVNLKQASQ